MEHKLVMWCSECGGEISEDEEILCDDCVQGLRDRIKELEEINYKLKVEVKVLKNKISELE